MIDELNDIECPSCPPTDSTVIALEDLIIADVDVALEVGYGYY